jgi:preprotein translocase subunit SecE
MALGIYKKGQGYYTRLCTTIAYAVLVAMGAWWVASQLKTVDFGFPTEYSTALGAVIVIAIFGLVGYVLIGRRARTVDFLIATEGEMKKVNWSTRREVVGSTIIVLIISFIIAALCASFDLVFAWFFTIIDVLEPAV